MWCDDVVHACVALSCDACVMWCDYVVHMHCGAHTNSPCGVSRQGALLLELADGCSDEGAPLGSAVVHHLQQQQQQGNSSSSSNGVSGSRGTAAAAMVSAVPGGVADTEGYLQYLGTL
jgi:hypothetical protein